ncbi:uncharacterized protein LOC130552757 isoform X1 [Triplophysa rosa]|uniref:uncharacterized protein LOC130552757 isoform X1 n=1 Tax=Triplophysa rosa TaxID=992332 RepID=UPI002545CF6A|nr:uncharacterized protein LOC130552757 isoform X1 [Triplophysa rosa]
MELKCDHSNNEYGNELRLVVPVSILNVLAFFDRSPQYRFTAQHFISLLELCKVVRNMVGTLANLSELRKSRFGQPYPRHGLSLLWWFANDFVDIDRNGRMFTRYNPEDGSFGFHKFHNLEGLLPHTDLTYYEVGNLSNRHHPQHAFPHAVTKNYDPDVPDSNTDRIIVSVHSSRNQVWFDKVYVTQHSDQTRFDQNRTYLIRREIIEDIRNLSAGEFLRQMKNDQHFQSLQIEPIQDSTHEQQRSYQSTEDECCKTCCCLIGCALIVAIIILVYLAK